MDYARQWRDRMLFELHDSPSAVFVTLTYNPESLPTNTFFDFDLQTEIVEPTLSVRDVQLFFKRLRKKFTGRRIRYYLCGEYGPKTFRPHYHAIIYGLSMVDFPDAVIQGYNELGQAHFSSLSFDNIWSKGFCRFSPVSSQTCAYVSRYVTKKHYKSLDPRFFRMVVLLSFLFLPGIPVLVFSMLLSMSLLGILSLPLLSLIVLLHLVFLPLLSSIVGEIRC